MEPMNSGDNRPLNFKEWALSIFVASLPIIGLIMLLIWAFSSSENVHRREWAKGKLLLAVIGIVLVILFLFVFGGMAMLGAAMNQ